MTIAGTASLYGWQRGPVATGPGTLTSARQFLEGRWGLASFEIFPPGKEPLRLTGHGTLVYDRFGNLAMELRVDEREALVLEEVGIPHEDGVVSLKGRTVIDLQAQTLVFVLDGQPPFGAPSGPLALNRRRYWAVEHDVLTLTTKDDHGRPLSIGRWERTP
jgi:hypothetical protein